MKIIAKFALQTKNGKINFKSIEIIGERIFKGTEKMIEFAQKFTIFHKKFFKK